MSQQEANTKLCIEFMTVVFNNLDFSSVDKYLAANIIEHNPDIGDGAEAFKTTIPPMMADTPKGSWVLKRSVAEGNMVVLHSTLPIGGKQYAIADFYRVEGGKIVEHWDVLQEMTPSTANPHPFF